MKRDLATKVVFLTILIIAGLFIYGNYREVKKVEVREVIMNGIYFKVPPGYREITERERKSYGFAKRLKVLVKGDFGRLIMADVEVGLPEKMLIGDLRSYIEDTQSALETNVMNFSLVEKTVEESEWEYSFVYTGKGKEGPYAAVFFSKIFPGKKLNVTVAGPEGTIDEVKEQVKFIEESIRTTSQ